MLPGNRCGIVRTHNQDLFKEGKETNEKLQERDLHHCVCCHPPKRTLVVKDELGRQAYKCLETGNLVQYIDSLEEWLPVIRKHALGE